MTGCISAPEQTAPPADSNQPTNDVSELNWKVPDFTFIDQNGEKVGLKDLEGKYWLTDFVFTRCPNVCPPMTANMAKVQQHVKQAGTDLTFVSFSVDPDYDKPEVLKKFADEHGADHVNWHFLTGYQLEEIQKIVKDTFKGAIIHQKGSSPEVPLLVNHPTQFYLIDGTGKVVKFYDGLNPDPEQILKDVQELQKK